MKNHPRLPNGENDPIRVLTRFSSRSRLFAVSLSGLGYATPEELYFALVNLRFAPEGRA